MSNVSDKQFDLPDRDLAFPGELPGASSAEFREQAEIDALLRLQSGELSVPGGLARRVRMARWDCRLRTAMELAAAAVIVIALTVSLLIYCRPAYRLEGRAEVTDGEARTVALTPGAWIKTGSDGATLAVRDLARINISPQARLQLAGAAGDCRVRVDYGQVLVKTERDANKAEIETSAGRVTVGTGQSAVRVVVEKLAGARDRKLTVTVVEGEAVLAGPDGAVRLTAGDVRSLPAEKSQPKLPPVKPALSKEQPTPTVPPPPIPPGGPGGSGASIPQMPGVGERR